MTFLHKNYTISDTEFWPFTSCNETLFLGQQHIKLNCKLLTNGCYCLENSLPFSQQSLPLVRQNTTFPVTNTKGLQESKARTSPKNLTSTGSSTIRFPKSSPTRCPPCKTGLGRSLPMTQSNEGDEVAIPRSLSKKHLISEHIHQNIELCMSPLLLAPNSPFLSHTCKPQQIQAKETQITPVPNAAKVPKAKAILCDMALSQPNK